MAERRPAMELAAEMYVQDRRFGRKWGGCHGVKRQKKKRDVTGVALVMRGRAAWRAPDYRFSSSRCESRKRRERREQR